MWQLRKSTEEISYSSNTEEIAQESEDPVPQTMWYGPAGIVATRYLTSTTAPDNHINIFRETTV